jgi:hypothetical protein
VVLGLSSILSWPGITFLLLRNPVRHQPQADFVEANSIIIARTIFSALALAVTIEWTPEHLSGSLAGMVPAVRKGDARTNDLKWLNLLLFPMGAGERLWCDTHNLEDNSPCSRAP